MAASVPVTFTDPAWLEEERRCLAALRRGDRRAFDRLYAVMAPPLYARVLLPRLGDAEAAADVLSESFARLVERLDGYEDRGGSIWSWLVTIAANRALDLHRERARGGRAPCRRARRARACADRRRPRPPPARAPLRTTPRPGAASAAT